MDEQVLAGGVANAGAVTRQGRHVFRPANPHSGSIHQFLHELRRAGFDGASEPVGFDPEGREQLVFVEGDVALPPYPAWVQTDDALASVAALLRRFHDASRQVDVAGMTWSTEISDPAGGSIIGHNDVCLENVVFRDGQAVALLDWDFAAPGRPTYDLAQFARMCIPVDDEVSAERNGFAPADRPARLRVVADAYGLDGTGRGELLSVLGTSIDQGEAFVRRRLASGDPNFIEMVRSVGGMERFDRRRLWWTEHRAAFAHAMR